VLKSEVNPKDKKVEMSYEIKAKFMISYERLKNSICPKIMALDLNPERTHLAI
jgi:hypothetical protein